MLHITNGESVVTSFRQSRFPGKYLSWIDVLHDGPVPDVPTLEALSDVRAQTLAGFGCGTYEKIRAGFAERDTTLAAFRQHEEVVLWFEHDLFDQLQVLQLLDWFSSHDIGKTRVALIQINSHPGVVPFYGLGQLSATQLVRVFPLRRTVSAMQMSVGKEVWRAFRAADPSDLFALADFSKAGKEFPEMPFLRDALLRWFEEFPSVQEGLSRTQWQLLKAAEAGARTKRDLYMASSKAETCPWSDASVFLRIEILASGPQPALLKKSADDYELTDAGRQLLAGKADWAKLSGGIDVWLGGTHLTGEPAWRWDGEARRLVAHG
jgi:hypothetical protein